MDENYISFPNSRELVDYSLFFYFILFCEKSFDILWSFEILIEKMHSMLIDVYSWLQNYENGWKLDLGWKWFMVGSLRSGLKWKVNTWCWPKFFFNIELGVDQVFLFFWKIDFLYFCYHLVNCLTNGKKIKINKNKLKLKGWGIHLSIGE